MTFSGVLNLLGAIVTLATVTTVILPGRETPEVIRAVGDLFTDSLAVAISGNVPR